MDMVTVVIGGTRCSRVHFLPLRRKPMRTLVLAALAATLLTTPALANNYGCGPLGSVAVNVFEGEPLDLNTQGVYTDLIDVNFTIPSTAQARSCVLVQFYG